MAVWKRFLSPDFLDLLKSGRESLLHLGFHRARLKLCRLGACVRDCQEGFFFRQWNGVCYC